MSDEEVICEFMEARPPDTKFRYKSEQGWWLTVKDENGWHWECVTPTLDRLHEVEERLTPRQWREYEAALEYVTLPPPRNPDQPWLAGPDVSYFRDICHASVSQKIRALAKVLREGSRG